MKKNTLLYIGAILAVVGIVYSFFAFDKAFPIVNVKITADKSKIENLADSLSREFALMDSSYRTVVAFDTDSRFKNYVELEGGGVDVFQDIVDKGTYHPYIWSVRQFNHNQIEECEFSFSPDGKLLGFKLTIPDSLEGADIIDPDPELMLNNMTVRKGLIPDLSNYSLIEKSSELKEGGRRDHVFTYELKGEGVGEALYRLKVRISGDQLTMVMPTVKIPEAFDQRYEEMRSANTTISAVGQAIMLIIYGLLGVGLALFFMLRKKTLIWRPALKWAIVIGALIFLAYLTTISLSWFGYDTSLSAGQFLFQRIFGALLNGLLIALIFFVSATAGEGLGRQAFPDQIQLWRSWSPEVGASKEIMRHTVFGYLWAFFMIGFITFFYWVSNNVFNWWSPAENMVDPNILALPMPWLLPAAQSLQAGFWEETLFRAVPLAGALVIGKNFKNKNVWLVIVLILQAAIFGAMHANYAQQPAYARIIEMIIPFVIYGLIYVNWGLLPVVISHFVYDIILMSLPLFLLSAPGIWFHRLLAIIAMLIPLGIVTFRRMKAGTWYKIKDTDLNKAVVEPKPQKPEKEEKVISSTSHKHRELPVFVAIILLIGGALLWIFLTPFEQDVPRLDINREQAIEIGDKFVEKYYPETDSLNYRVYVKMDGGAGKGSRFVWEHGDRELYRDLYGKELYTNNFSLVYKTYEGNVVRRSQTIDILIGRDGEVLGWKHNVPEPVPGAQLNESEALAMAAVALEKHFNRSADELELVKVVPEKRKARTDWTIIYRDLNTGLEDGDIRYVISLSGDELSGINTKVHTPESWDRQQKKEGLLKTVLFIVSKLIQYGMLVTVLIFAIIAWTKKRFNTKLFLYFILFFAVISILQSLLAMNSIIAIYPTSEPYSNIIMMLVIGILIGTVFSSFLYSLPIGYMARIPLHVQRNEQVIGLKGMGLGLVFAAFVSLAQGDVFNLSPVVLSPLNLETASPILSTILTSFESYFITFVLLMVPFMIADKVSAGWSKAKVITAILLFLSGFAYTGEYSIGMWILGGSFVGLLMVALYVWVFRFNIIYLPVMAAVILIADEIQYMIVNPAVLSLPQTIITIVITTLLAIFTVWGMYRVRLLQPEKSKR